MTFAQGICYKASNVEYILLYMAVWRAFVSVCVWGGTKMWSFIHRVPLNVS